MLSLMKVVIPVGCFHGGDSGFSSYSEPHTLVSVLDTFAALNLSMEHSVAVS